MKTIIVNPIRKPYTPKRPPHTKPVETHLKSQEAKSRTQIHTAAAGVIILSPDENTHLIPLESYSLGLKFQGLKVLAHCFLRYLQ